MEKTIWWSIGSVLQSNYKKLIKKLEIEIIGSMKNIYLIIILIFLQRYWEDILT